MTYSFCAEDSTAILPPPIVGGGGQELPGLLLSGKERKVREAGRQAH